MCNLRLEPNDLSPQSARARLDQRFLKEIDVQYVGEGCDTDVIIARAKEQSMEPVIPPCEDRR